MSNFLFVQVTAEEKQLELKQQFLPFRIITENSAFFLRGKGGEAALQWVILEFILSSTGKCQHPFTAHIRDTIKSSKRNVCELEKTEQIHVF